MENLVQSPTTHTPAIDFNYETGVLDIWHSYSGNILNTFFQPVMNWLETYKKNPAPVTTLIFKMEYFNTSSTAFILRIIKIASQLKDQGNSVFIQWFYQEEDDDLVEAGRDFGVLAETEIEL